MTIDRQANYRIDPGHRISELIEQCDRNEPDVHTIARLLSHDEILSARVLQETNAVINAPRNRITHLRHAVALLGAIRVKTIAAKVLASPVSEEKRHDKR